MGYNTSKPLLYYSRKLALNTGYDVVEVNYELPVKAKEILNDKAGMKEVFDIAIRQVEDKLSSVNFGEYTRVLFIGKSIGTALAAYYAREHQIEAMQLILTPVPQTFDLLQGARGIVFHGLSDPWCDNDIAEDKCKELSMELITVDNANHSLETGDVIIDLDNMKQIMEKIGIAIK